MEIIYTKKGGEGVRERCIKNDKGDFIGVKTGNLYSGDVYYASEKIKAKVIGFDSKQENGMYHLGPDSEESIRKKKYIGCVMTFREAHGYGKRTVYHCYETDEYFNDLELEIIK